MNRATAIIYSETGEILGVRSGSSENISVDIESNEGRGFFILEADLPDNIEDYYVSDSQELLEKGVKTTELQDFDYQEKQWVTNIDIAKERLWNAIKSKRTEAEFGNFEWDGYVFECDEVSQRRIQGAVQLAALDSAITLDWTLADNSVQTFSAADYIQIGQALANHVSQCHERGRILRQQINSSTTEAELEAIVW